MVLDPVAGFNTKVVSVVTILNCLRSNLILIPLSFGFHWGASTTYRLAVSAFIVLFASAGCAVLRNVVGATSGASEFWIHSSLCPMTAL